MKFRNLLAMTVLLSSMMANASCFKTYQDRIAETQDFIDNSNYKQTMKETAGLITSTNVLVISGLSGGAGGPLVSTAAGAGLIGSLYLGSTYIDLRKDDGVDEALARRDLLESSLSLLREAKVGYGSVLSETIGEINRTISTSISMKDLADKINEQSSGLVYCQTPDQIMSPAGILQTAIDELN